MRQSLEHPLRRRRAHVVGLWMCVLGSVPLSALSTQAEQSTLPAPAAQAEGLAAVDRTVAQMQRAPLEIGPKYVYICRGLTSFLTEYCGNVVYRYTAFPTNVTVEPLLGKPAGVRYVLHYAIQGSGSAFPTLTLGGVAGQRFQTATALAVDVRDNPDHPGCPTIQSEPNWVMHPVVQVANGVPATLDDLGNARIKSTLGTGRSSIQEALGCR